PADGAQGQRASVDDDVRFHPVLRSGSVTDPAPGRVTGSEPIGPSTPDRTGAPQQPSTPRLTHHSCWAEVLHLDAARSTVDRRPRSSTAGSGSGNTFHGGWCRPQDVGEAV